MLGNSHCKAQELSRCYLIAFLFLTKVGKIQNTSFKYPYRIGLFYKQKYL